MRRLSLQRGKLFFYCPKCMITYEIEIELEDAKDFEIFTQDDLEKMRLLPEDLPDHSPKPLKIIAGIKSRGFIPIYYRLLRASAPKAGREITAEYLEFLGIPNDVSKRLADFLRRRGIIKFYEFQEKAIKLGIDGKNLVIVAPTGMGKTEAFLIPALSRVIKENFVSPPHVILVYPTKALARDQALKIGEYCRVFGLRLGVIDGDTPSHERKKILSNPPEILLTNFDMMHYHLAKRTPIGNLFLRVKILVIDELHEYFGAFGTHVHYIIKRLKRRNAYGRIQFLMASATIRNPAEFASKFVEEDIIVISEIGRKTPLHVLFVYSIEPIQRTSAILAKEMIKNKIKTLIFFNTRKSAELSLHILMKIARIESEIRDLFDLHRAGLPKELRAKIEDEFRRGKKLVLFATPTLELGIDIGDVDLVISEITPIDRFIQRSGRAGRRDRPGSAILLLRDDDPISDFYAKNPKEYFGDISLKYIEKRNPYIAKRHIYLAAYEKPIVEEELKSGLFDREIVNELLSEGALIKVGDKFFANGSLFNNYFSRNIRGAEKNIRVIFRGKRIDERELHIAVRELYPGAIYLNRGVKYISKRLDINKLIAEVELAPREFQDLYTKPIYTSRAVFVGKVEERDVFGTKLYFGKMRMHEIIEGYVVYQEGSKKPIAEYPLEKPIHYQYETFGMAFKSPPANFGDPDKDGGAYHALEHVLIEGTNAITGGGSEDLGGISFYPIGIIVIHDATPGGNGVSRILYEKFERAVERALDILKSCRCPGDPEFCNKCVYSYRCGNNNRPLYQMGAMKLLERLLLGEPVPDADKTPEILTIIEKGIV